MVGAGLCGFLAGNPRGVLMGGMSKTNEQRALRAYNLRKNSRIFWKDIARIVGYADAASAHKCVTRFRNRRNLPNPPGYLGDAEMAYMLRSEGSTWFEIDRTMNSERGRSRRLAGQWCRRHGLDWDKIK